mmetsp:Transcript_35703/g.81100  ORF Transcript_35703/g.81100 Transcript_35703/m.81100 type:complete len:588 (-) Transcript_35703:197-1960(-)
MKGIHHRDNWWKLMSLTYAQIYGKAQGIDILCVNKRSPTENTPMKVSGFADYLKSEQALNRTVFGPTTINMVPMPIVDGYILERYGKADPCSFPYTQGVGSAGSSNTSSSSTTDGNSAVDVAAPALLRPAAARQTHGVPAASHDVVNKVRCADETCLRGALAGLAPNPLAPTTAQSVIESQVTAYMRPPAPRKRPPQQPPRAAQQTSLRPLAPATCSEQAVNGSSCSWYTSLAQRAAWATLGNGLAEPGVSLTSALPGLNAVEVDNSISHARACESNAGQLKVIVFNAERGTHWQLFERLVRQERALRQPDVILLNEMDIGMARSDNVHTTRRLAAAMGMNFAWGLEFVELSRGTFAEQNATVDRVNTLGLHGNAILSRCHIYDPVVLRDSFDPSYFSPSPNKVNAKGAELRLGARMGLFARIGRASGADERHYVVGSVHKLSLQSAERRNLLQSYFDRPVAADGSSQVSSSSPPLGVVFSGDMAAQNCAQAGIKLVKNETAMRPATFPSRCHPRPKLGFISGDFTCTDMPLVAGEWMTAPCHSAQTDQGRAVTRLSDHAIVSLVLGRRRTGEQTVAAAAAEAPPTN